ncbi:MAG: cation transporter [Bacteroidetes bacterium]|nr:cation transporter [Bacteroidota bacterium]
MQKTIFKIAKMDCPSEEQMIRMKLGDLENIKSLNFDIPNRQLTVYHNENSEQILEKLDSLKFDTLLVSSVSADNFSANDNNSTTERKLLWQVLLINFFFFVLESITGFMASSLGLVADSLDMLADTIVYGLAIFAVGGSVLLKKNIAKAAGVFQLLLAVFGFAEVIKRFLGYEEVPEFKTMIVVSVLALIGNAMCLYLLQKSKSKEAHIQASMIFTSNDVVVNFGVIVAGVLVYFTNSNYPDLIIGTLVFAVVAQGAIRIFKLSK